MAWELNTYCEILELRDSIVKMIAEPFNNLIVCSVNCYIHNGPENMGLVWPGSLPKSHQLLLREEPRIKKF